MEVQTRIYDVLQAAVTVIWCVSMVVLSGSWTPLISNDAGSTSILGAEIAYGTWFWWVGGIALASMVVGALLYLLGRRTEAAAQRGGPLPAAGSGS